MSKVRGLHIYEGMEAQVTAVWLVRCAMHREDEAWDGKQSLVAAGYEDTPDLAHVQSTGELNTVLQRTYPGDKPKTLFNWRGQLWACLHPMHPGNLVVVPLQTRPSIFIGTIAGPYRYRGDEPVKRRRHRPCVVAWRVASDGF